MLDTSQSNYRWFIISISALTSIFAIGVPHICMPVLFKEIANDLGLTLVQLGMVWGATGLAGLFTTLIGGVLGDRFGAKLTLSVACILAGIIGAMRGMSNSFIMLAVTMFFFGSMTQTIILNVHKTAGIWFSGREMVIANGIVSTGMGMGMMLGAMVSDTIMSPLLGGWTKVLFFYGGLTTLMGILWIFTKSKPVQANKTHTSEVLSFQENIFRVLRIKSVWLLGVAQLCYTGCVFGVIGYLPVYLRDIGWAPASADGTLAASNAAGMLAAIPLTIIAGKLGVRKGVLLLTLAITFVCVSLLSVIDNAWVWLLIVLIGLLRDGYFAVVVTTVIETDGIGADYAGSAVGMVWSFGSLGYFIAPPLGNSLASLAPGMPFLFWGVLVFASIPVMWRVGKVKYQ